MDNLRPCTWSIAWSSAPAGRIALARTGERIAAAHLTDAHGLVLVGANVRVAVEGLRGELDLVHQDGRTGLLVVSEVKARSASSGGGALDALGARQRARIRRMTAVLLTDGSLRARGVRFDLVTLDVQSGGRPVARLSHVMGAW